MCFASSESQGEGRCIFNKLEDREAWEQEANGKCRRCAHRTFDTIHSALFLDRAGLARTSDTRLEAAGGWRRRRWLVC